MKYYIIAGEASGDLHGGNLMRAIFERDPEANVRFWGGDKMTEAAATAKKSSPEGNGCTVTQVKHIKDLAFMGIVEVVSHLGTVLGNIRFCKEDIAQFKPDVMVFIDYPGFNLKIAKYTHRLGIRNVYYISPQIWAWKKNRIYPMRRDLDCLCYILPTERDFYAKNNFPQAVYVGHPLLDEVQRFRTIQSSSDDINRKHEEKPRIALLPGSRKQELKRMLPLMSLLAQAHGEFNFVIAGMSLIGEEFYRRYIPKSVENIEIVFDKTYELLSSAYAAVVCSGTATLETALFKVPQVVCYQCSRITAMVARLLLDKKLKYISLVNLIADAPIVTELIQGGFSMSRLDDEFRKITTVSDSRNRILTGYEEVIAILGGAGASQRTAQIVTVGNSSFGS